MGSCTGGDEHWERIALGVTETASKNESLLCRIKSLRRCRPAALIAIAAIFMVCDSSARAEDIASDKAVQVKQSNQVTKRAIGSAGRLRGCILIYHLFCNDEQTSWSESQRQRTLKTLHKACSFIRTQAAQHRQRIQLAHEIAPRIDFKSHIPVSHEADPIWTQRILEVIAKCSPLEHVEQLKQRHQAHHVAFCLHVNKSGLSYNLASYEGVDDRFQAERAVCFTRYPDGRETAAATYAHEILHLFGAGDLYFPYDRTTARIHRAKSLFPNDIMLRVDYNLRALNIGAYTAYRIGWHDKLSSQFAVFED